MYNPKSLLCFDSGTLVYSCIADLELRIRFPEVFIFLAKWNYYIIFFTHNIKCFSKGNFFSSGNTPVVWLTPRGNEPLLLLMLDRMNGINNLCQVLIPTTFLKTVSLSSKKGIGFMIPGIKTSSVLIWQGTIGKVCIGKNSAISC